MQICESFRITILTSILLSLMLVACQKSAPAEDLAMQIDGLHQELETWPDYSPSYAESRISDGACLYAEDLSKETNLRLPYTGAPESLLHGAAFDLAVACSLFEGEIERKEFWVRSYREGLSSFQLAFLSDDTIEQRAWWGITNYIRKVLDDSCSWLKAYDVVAEPEQSIKCNNRLSVIM